jgi:hypothetical protein
MAKEFVFCILVLISGDRFLTELFTDRNAYMPKFGSMDIEKFTSAFASYGLPATTAT